MLIGNKCDLVVNKEVSKKDGKAFAEKEICYSEKLRQKQW
jgi:hypothetical protein